MTLQFEEEIIGETVRSVPTVENGHFLVLAVGQLLPLEAVVFDVVDCFQVEYRSKGHQ